jgi:hypothetical protein
LTYVSQNEEMALSLRKAFRQALEQTRPHLAAIAADEG